MNDKEWCKNKLDAFLIQNQIFEGFRFLVLEND